MNFNITKKIQSPYLIYEFNNCLDNNCISEINNIITFIDKNLEIKKYNGKRDSNDKRFIIKKSNIYNYLGINKLIKNLIDIETVEYLELLGNITLKNCYLRMEIILDKENFWLEKHVDIPEKKITFLVFINDNNESINNGTDIYNDKLELVYSVPFIHNLGYMFFPNNKTWHGLEKGKNIKYRKVLMINYVTYETDWKL